jgi:hypothetical protein
MGVAQYAHYCCDTMSQAYFSAPSCDCEEEGSCDEEENSDCCKNEVKVVQLVQDGISSERSEIARPLSLSVFVNARVDISLTTTIAHSFLSVIEGNYKSPPIYLKNRLLLI